MLFFQISTHIKNKYVIILLFKLITKTSIKSIIIMACLIFIIANIN